MSGPIEPTTLDLSGEVCPYTYLRTMLALEEMDAGELVLLLDHAPAFRSVPAALRRDGHTVLDVSLSEDGRRCAVRVRKQGPAGGAVTPSSDRR